MDVVRSILCCSPTESFKLLDAAKAGDAVVAASIIQQKPRLARKAQQWGGQTAWHIAARDGHADVLTAMADSIKATDLSVLRSVWGTDLGATTDDILESLVQYQDTKGLSPLHLACIKGKTAAVDVLMKLGANPFAMDSVGRTPLHYAASWGFADCINAVLGHHSGPPKEGWGYTWPNSGETRLVDVQNAAGFTPLHYAVWVGRKQAIQALASYDASLKVVNSGNDFEWIKVGSGNTPLHLAAFGGDMQVVKLLLAAYVQSLAAGAEVMTAGRGQWGNRHTDDVRHIRNRRGWMPYHIAIHKGYEHLAELLHPDIPYTFIFSNEDMAPGSVRMYGPARLMVIAAKALQQKLVDELAQVEAATASDKPAAAAAVTITAAAPAPDGDLSELVGADEAVAVAAPAVIGAQVGSTPAAEPAAAAAGGAAPSIVSPFAARSGRGWASFSAGASEPTSAATSDAVPPSAVGTPAGSISNPAVAAGATPAAAAAVAAATAAVAAVEVSPTGTDHTEHSFAAADMQSQAAGTSTAAAAAPAAHARGSADGGSFAGFSVMQQPHQPSSSAAAAAAGSSDAGGWQQRGDNASVSDAGLSSSTIPASNAAVAGSAPGSISMGPVSRDSSMHKLQHGMLLAPTGQPVTAVEANSTARSVQWAPMQGSSSNAGSSQNLPAAAVQQHQQQQGSKHRRVQSATGVYSRQGSRGLSDTAAGVRGSDDQQQSKFPWSRMESMKRRNSKKDFSEWLPPSAVQTCADDDTDGHGNHTQPQNAATTSSRRSSQDNAASSSSQPLMRRISSLPIRIGSRVGPIAAAAPAEPATGQEQWQPHRASFDVSLQHPVHENPLNVMLAARAQQIGDNPEAIRQQLLAMKLASGALQFGNAISTFTTSLGSPLEAERAVSRFASFSQNLPVSSRNSIGSRPGVIGTVSPAAAQQPTAAVVEAAAAAAAALPSVHSSDGGTSSSPFAAFAAPQEQQQAVQVDSLNAQQQQQQQASLSPSPSLFNITAANVISQQASQSLQRLLSGSSRGRRAASTAPPQQQSTGSSIPGVTSGDVGASLSTSPAAAAAAGRESANGELPIVQLQYTMAVAAMISEGSSGLDEDDLCEICFDAAAVVALQQCGHTLCVGCCKELCKLHHFKPGLCPYCRQIICGFERATHVFIP